METGILILLTLFFISIKWTWIRENQTMHFLFIIQKAISILLASDLPVSGNLTRTLF
jgi:hypothetical protein